MCVSLFHVEKYFQRDQRLSWQSRRGGGGGGKGARISRTHRSLGRRHVAFEVVLPGSELVVPGVWPACGPQYGPTIDVMCRSQPSDSSQAERAGRRIPDSLSFRTRGGCANTETRSTVGLFDGSRCGSHFFWPIETQDFLDGGPLHGATNPSTQQ